MKGKNTFSISEISELRDLITKRIKADRNQQKSIRDKMRNIGFYARDDFDITDLQPEDFELLITTGRIKIINEAVLQEVNSEINSRLLQNDNTCLSENYAKEIYLNKFSEFNPLTDNEDKIPDAPGNYIVCLSANSKLPDVGFQFKTQKMNNLEVIYTGIASKSIRTRDYKHILISITLVAQR